MRQGKEQAKNIKQEGGIGSYLQSSAASRLLFVMSEIGFNERNEGWDTVKKAASLFEGEIHGEALPGAVGDQGQLLGN